MSVRNSSSPAPPRASDSVLFCVTMGAWHCSVTAGSSDLSIPPSTRFRH